MIEFHDWDEIRAELHDLADERKRSGLTQRQVADLIGATPGRISQIENGDLDAYEVMALIRYKMIDLLSDHVALADLRQSRDDFATSDTSSKGEVRAELERRRSRTA